MALKDYQLQSADRIFRALFVDRSTRHFLLADEVGLGKTHVAKEAVKKLWKQNRQKLVRVFYVCNNLSLAHQNRERLIPDELKKSYKDDAWKKRFLVSVDRLSLLHKIPPDTSTKDRLKIYSLTPGTSFNTQHLVGKREEKQLLSRILGYGLPDTEKVFFDNYFRGWLRGWSKDETKVLNPGDLQKALQSVEIELNGGIVSVRELLKIPDYKGENQIIDACRKSDIDENYEHRQVREYFRGDARPDIYKVRSKVIKQLVIKLSLLNFEKTEQHETMDLIILDEFQNFEHVLNLRSGTKDNAIARAMFSNNRILIMSATPYRAYSADEKGHYDEFSKVLRFLFEGRNGCSDPKQTVETLLKELDRYHKMLVEYFKGNGETSELDTTLDTTKEKIIKRKDSIEARLREVIVRTERYHFIRDKNKGITAMPASIDQGAAIETRVIPSEKKELLKRSFEEFFWLSSHDLFRSNSKTIALWKSGDKLLSFMSGNYQSVRDLYRPEDGGNENARSKELEAAAQAKIQQEVKRKDPRHFLLQKKEVSNYEVTRCNNEKLDYLMKETLHNAGTDCYLWLPPTTSYYSDEFFKSARGPGGLKKMLVFSGWRFVPSYVSAMLSYEWECRRRQSYLSHNPGETSYPKRTNTLTTGDKFSAANVLYSSLYFASEIQYKKDGKLRSASRIVNATKKKIRQFVEGVAKSGGQLTLSGRKKRRQSFYLQLLALDFWFLRTAHGIGAAAALDILNKLLPGETAKLEEENLTEVLEADLEALAEIALFSPAVCIARSLMEVCPVTKEPVEPMAVVVDTLKNAGFFFHTLAGYFSYWAAPIQETVEARERGGRKKRVFSEKVLEYCKLSNFQAVMDEYAFMLQNEFAGRDNPVESILAALDEVFRVRGGWVKVYYRGGTGDHANQDEESGQMKTSFAMAFSDVRPVSSGKDGIDPSLSGGGVLRSTTIRKAFNSPFFPFVLVTTSVGQEGLDFHYYCKDILHWNLPNNPVDLEQREGRINRFNGLVVRRNVSRWINNQTVGGRPLAKRAKQDKNLWNEYFRIVNQECASLDRYNRGLFPHWIFSIDEDSKAEQITRHVPCQTMSADRARYRKLTEYLAYYRLALGQARQDDFINELRNSNRPMLPNRSNDELNQFTINLSPANSIDYSRHYAKTHLKKKGDWQMLLEQCRKSINELERHPPDGQLEETKRVIELASPLVQGLEDCLQTGKRPKPDLLFKLVYFINPYDRMPDYLPGGYEDDIEVLRGVNPIEPEEKSRES